MADWYFGKTYSSFYFNSRKLKKKEHPSKPFCPVLRNTLFKIKKAFSSQPYTRLKIRFLYLPKTEIRKFPRIPQETTSPIPTVSIRKGIGSTTP